MIETLKIFGTRAITALRLFSPGQITAIVIGILALLVGAMVLLRVTASPLTPLYSNLSSEDAVAISEELEVQGTAYELNAGGTQILVAPEDVSASRLTMSAAGLPADAKQEGQSLIPLMKNPQKEWNHPAITSFGLGNYSVRSSRYRFIQYHDGSREMYDLKKDPHEWNNLIKNPKMKSAIVEHAAFIPKKQHPILPGNSTGHNAYKAANANITH